MSPNLLLLLQCVVGGAGGGWIYPRCHSQPAGPFDVCVSNVSRVEKEAEDIYVRGPGEALENEGPRCALGVEGWAICNDVIASISVQVFHV